MKSDQSHQSYQTYTGLYGNMQLIYKQIIKHSRLNEHFGTYLFLICIAHTATYTEVGFANNLLIN